jgi:hypothetical protein
MGSDNPDEQLLHVGGKVAGSAWVENRQPRVACLHFFRDMPLFIGWNVLRSIRPA